MALMYCKKCGRLVINFFIDEKLNCDCCGAETYKVPQEYLLVYNDEICENNIKDEKTKLKLYDELVKPSAEFDQNLFDHRDEILAQNSAEYYRVINIGNAILNGAKPEEAFKGNFNVAKCPSCGSANISKIGIVNRALSVSLFGLASNKIGKNYKCNNCGTAW